MRAAQFTSAGRFPSRRAGFTIIEVVVTILIVIVLIALLMPATRIPREAAERSQCKNYLKQIGIALHNYHDVYGAFPPAYTVDANGKPLHSWRTLLLPHLDKAALYHKLDLTKPWDDPVNAEVFKQQLGVYGCSSAPIPQGQTTYLAVVTADSCLQPNQPRPLSEIKDGISSTIVVIEVPHDHAVPWMSPQDASESLLLNLGDKPKVAHPGGRHALLCDGTVRFISKDLAVETFKALLTVNGGETIGDY